MPENGGGSIPQRPSSKVSIEKRDKRPRTCICVSEKNAQKLFPSSFKVKIQRRRLSAVEENLGISFSTYYFLRIYKLIATAHDYSPGGGGTYITAKLVHAHLDTVLGDMSYSVVASPWWWRRRRTSTRGWRWRCLARWWWGWRTL